MLTAAAAPASADAAGFANGAKLYSQLVKQQQGIADFESFVALGYVQGVHDALDGLAFCTPPDAVVGQLARITYNYMQKHPEQWNEAAAYSVANALHDTWPCTK